MTGELQGLTAGQMTERVREGKINTLPERSGRTTWQIVHDRAIMMARTAATGGPRRATSTAARAMVAQATPLITVVSERGSLLCLVTR